MKAKPKLEQSMQEEQIRAALDQHWAASDANDFETEHRIYLDDAVLVDSMMTLAEAEALANWVALHKLRSRETDSISERRTR
jgi:ketosteroid isomerase-like protein